MLQPYQISPKLSAYSSLEGIHDYNAHPVALFGIEVTVHETANQQATQGLSGIKGWYIGPTLERLIPLRVTRIWQLPNRTRPDGQTITLSKR
eukprot:4718490-Ditylum_brightwellii.AAC.1